MLTFSANHLTLHISPDLQAKRVVSKYNRPVSVPDEFYTLLQSLKAGLDIFAASAKDSDAEVAYWDASNTARETYRDATVATFEGGTSDVSAARLVEILTAMEAKMEAGIEKALATNRGLSPSYFYYECTDFSINTPGPDTKNSDGTSTAAATTVTAKAFKTHSLPLFLEGPVRHMKVMRTVDEKRDLYGKVRHSKLFDEALKMYVLSESLEAMGQDVGRMKAFSPGWLENQSVWLHMSYKFYLELLRGELFEEFWAEVATGLVPFMDPKIYGRSPLEAASFIVSSAFPDPKLHGASFLARLSGSTAEFLSMWALMFAGPHPFGVSESGVLQLQLRPAIPGWLFTDDGLASFTFLGSVKITYHNPTKVDTWTVSPSRAELAGVDGMVIESGAIIEDVLAESVRNGKIASIDVFF